MYFFHLPSGPRSHGRCCPFASFGTVVVAVLVVAVELVRVTLVEEVLVLITFQDDQRPCNIRRVCI